MILKVLFLLAVSVASLNSWSSESQVADKNLQTCLNDIAAKKQWDSATDFTEIKCHNLDIKSIEGLDVFVNIEKLSLYKNDISSADLRGFKHLQHINLARNKLKMLNLSELPQLVELFFFDNEIVSLTLKDLPRLEEFKGNANAMKAFDYSNLPAVKKVYLFDNELETIDIHNLPSLEYMDVRENPMPDKLYEDMDAMVGVTILHDGNADDW